MADSKIVVWDFPTRAFHWSLAIAFALAWATGDSERWRDGHVVAGYTMLGLVVFRLLWGIVGSRYARFSSFAYGPRRVLAYVRSLFTRSPQRYVGHNPAGSWAIYALLSFALLAIGTGYATYEEIGGKWMEEAHEAFSGGMILLVFVHLAGVAVSSLLHRENLVRAMWTGRKRARPLSSPIDA